MEEPSISELFNLGCKKPDCLSTVGSGWKISKIKHRCIINFKIVSS